ncbi:MAG: sigma-70 family RNA polymerase sigma factor [Candidatus Eiseniibacteriota bacterium]
MLLRRKLAALQPELLAYARSLAPDGHEAEDLVHDAVLRALQARSVPRRLAELRPWMFRVIKNLLIDRARKARVQREYSAAQERLSGIDSAVAGDVVESLVVRQAYDSLGQTDREILCLVDILGLSYAEAAHAIGIPVGTVMSRVSRARRTMIARIEDSNIRPLRQRRA